MKRAQFRVVSDGIATKIYHGDKEIGNRITGVYIKILPEQLPQITLECVGEVEIDGIVDIAIRKEEYA